MNIGIFKTNEEAELDGIWKRLGSGAKVKVARAENPSYTKMLRKETAKHSAIMWSEDLSDEESEVIFNKIIATTILLDWKGLEEVKGVEVPYTIQTAIKWLTKYKEFKKIIVGISNDVGNYRDKKTMEVQSNIKK